MPSNIFSFKIFILSSLVLCGCIAQSYPYLKTETAQRIATPAWMIKRNVVAPPFNLRAYERMHERGGVANLYIEGDTLSIKGTTPSNPIGLHLASKDKASNVVYLARPCQYTSSISNKCDSKHVTTEQFSEEVIESYNTALNDIARRYDITSFNLIGHSGGGAIASLLAAKRHDILSVRTIAGVIDHTAYSAINGADYSGSINPASEASALSKIPQYHFIGGQDTIIPPAVLHSYLQSMPPTHCVQSMLIQENGHTSGWVNRWPELLKLPVNCFARPSGNADRIMEPATMPHKLPNSTHINPAKP